MDDLVNSVHKDMIRAGHAQGDVTGDRWYNREIRTLDPAAHRMQNNAPARDRQNAM
jgi:hypothetical protein